VLLFWRGLCVAASSTPASPAAAAVAVAGLDAELGQSASLNRFSGVVLVAQHGKPILEAAYGYADRDRRISNTPATRFNFGSLGKMFTGVAVMQLVQAGKIRLEDPVSKYLPDYPNREVAAATIHQLLTHTGGTGDIFSPEIRGRESELHELGDYIAILGARAPRFVPGARFEYSNYGMIILGRIVEVVSGEKYRDYVRDHVFKPAGMTSTDNLLATEAPDYATGYTRRGPPGAEPPEEQEAPLQPTRDMLFMRGTAAGGGYSTVGDLFRFARALVSNRLLDAEHTAVLTTGKITTPKPGTKYAYGFEDMTTAAGTRCFGHSGGAPGVNATFTIFPASDSVVIVLSNFDPPAALEAERLIVDRLGLQ
jgi:CubicO group peptidase (beta-lactamase class C family)